MRIFFFTLFFVCLLASCNGGDEKKEQPKTTDITQDPIYQKGLQLASEKLCFSCHAIDAKITGPSYREVADKYAGYPDTIVSHLADKVIMGGSGVWGDQQMTPHPDLSKQDAETLVRYVLMLKTKK